MDLTCSVADAVRSGERTAVDVLDQARAAIEARNGDLNAAILVDFASAEDDARRLDQMVRDGQDPGPLAGVPFLVKDLDDAGGFRTTHGSRLYADSDVVALGNEDPYVRRARAAGALVVGKSNVPEFGLDINTTNQLWGRTKNPWDLGKTVGESSGGAASAVAGGLVPLASASDGAGSIRCPAAYTGLVGLKPTHGLVPLPSRSVSWTTVTGCVTRDVAGTARYLDVVRGEDPRDWTSRDRAPGQFEHDIETLDASGLRVTWTPDMGHGLVDDEVAAICESAIERIIRLAALTEVHQPVDLPLAIESWVELTSAQMFANLTANGFLPARRSELGPTAQQAVLSGASFSPASLHLFGNLQADTSKRLAELFSRCDIIASPTNPVPAFDGVRGIEKIGDTAVAWGADAYMHPMANLGWIPAISIPAGLTREGLPVGLQLMARRGQDALLLRIARLWEQYVGGFPVAPGMP